MHIYAAHAPLMTKGITIKITSKTCFLCHMGAFCDPARIYKDTVRVLYIYTYAHNFITFHVKCALIPCPPHDDDVRDAVEFKRMLTLTCANACVMTCYISTVG